MGGLYVTATLLARLHIAVFLCVCVPAATEVAAPLFVFLLFSRTVISEGLVAQWIRHRPTEPGIAGSSPAKVIFEA